MFLLIISFIQQDVNISNISYFLHKYCQPNSLLSKFMQKILLSVSFSDGLEKNEKKGVADNHPPW